MSVSTASTFNCIERFCLPPGISISAKVIDILDGDTLRCAIVSPLTHRIASVDVRLAGIDTAETKTKAHTDPSLDLLEKNVGLLTRTFVAWLLGVPIDRETFVSEIEHAHEREVATMSRTEIANALGESHNAVFLNPVQSQHCANTTFDSFGRVIAEVQPIGGFKCPPGDWQDTWSLPRLLLSRRIALPYDHVNRAAWTDEALKTALEAMRTYVTKTEC